MVQQGSALVSVDGILLMANPKHHVLQIIKQLNDTTGTRKLRKKSPKTYFSGVQL